jgi:hypothetical protein
VRISGPISGPPGGDGLGFGRRRLSLGRRDGRAEQPLRYVEPGQLAQPDDAERVDPHDDGQHELPEDAVVRLQEAVVEHGQEDRHQHRDRDDDLHAAPGGPPAGVDLAAHVEFLADRVGERAEQVAQARAAQPGVDDQRRDDHVRA